MAFIEPMHRNKPNITYLLEMGRGQRHTLDAVPCHCSFQVWLWLHCVWHGTVTPTYDNWTAFITLDWDWRIGSFLHQPSVQPVHRGQRSSFGGTSVKAVHALLCENSCLHWQSGTSCPAWIRPNHYRFICSQAKWKRRHDPTPGPSHWSQSRRSHDLCRDQCRIGLPPEDTQLSTRNAWLWSQETRPHWRSK